MEPMRCAEHPNVETRLSCSRCGKPICPRCLVQTPVGARCRQCAGLRRIPTYEVRPVHYLRASFVGAGLAIGVGAAWYLIGTFIPFVGLFLALGAGYVIGEALALSVNRKRSTGLQVIAGSSFIASWLIASLLPPALLLLRIGNLAVPILSQALGRTIIGNLTSLYALIFLALGLIIAISRVRQ